MKVLGVVVEFNPMHNGHHYFIEKAKETIKPDITIAIMSSSFSMRGDFMVIDKWSRSTLAIDHGIDIVLELPYLAAVNSSDFFCYNAIKTLVDFGITDISFGVELDNLDKLQKIKDLLVSSKFNEMIKPHLDNGHSYATSSYKAIRELTNDQDIIDYYSLPNNTLAIGYLKAIDSLKKDINVTLIKRIANNYYDSSLNNTLINSATSLRNEIAKGNNISNQTRIDYLYYNTVNANNMLFNLLRYQFLNRSLEEIKSISGVNEGIENRINSFINTTENYDDFINKVQTRRYSLNRIKRIVLNILLNISKEYENKHHNYLRILAMNKKGIEYVNQLPKKIKKQIITSFKNIDNYIVETEIKVSKLYSLVCEKPEMYLNEFKTPYIKGVESK